MELETSTIKKQNKTKEKNEKAHLNEWENRNDTGRAH